MARQAIRPPWYWCSYKDDEIEKASNRFGKLVKLSRIEEVPLFYNGNCIGGRYTTFTGAVRSIEALKHFEERGLPLTLTVFDILDDLQNTEGKTIIMVEQNAKKGLEFADIGYVLVSGQLAIAGTGDELLQNPKVGELFLGG